jgi:hypothetical protein
LIHCPNVTSGTDWLCHQIGSAWPWCHSWWSRNH